MMMTKDEGLRAVREVRKKISAEFDNDPEKLVAHYIEQQKRHGTRLLEPVAAQQGAALDGDSAALHPRQ
ncbi:MAG: hypothetical protein ACE5I7_19345 [Candidatus Binatia bacterium]